MATYMVANGRNAGSYGYGNAVAVVLFLISLVVALLYQRFVLRRDTAGALTGQEASNDAPSTAPPRRRRAPRPPPHRGRRSHGADRRTQPSSTSSRSS